MGTVINITLPESLSKEVNSEVKRLRLSSKSELFRRMFREWRANNLAKEFVAEDAKIRSGKEKIKALKTVKSLWK